MARTLPAASRRDFLYQCAAGLGGVALSAPLHREQAWAGLVSPRPRPAGKAKACIFLLMEGGPSHIDTFDPKPELERFHMTQSVEAGKRRFVKSPFLFRRAGQSGAGICTLFEHLSECIDDICFYRGAVAESTNHLAALHHLNTGSMFAGSPAIGARVAHSLGNGSGNLPAFVVLPDAEYPCGGAANWSNGLLPPGCRGSAIRPATIGLEKEPEATRRMYGVGEEVTDALGRRCLHAHRLVERGVCFVQVHCGGWDSHDDIETSHGNCMRSVDRPVAALLKDLKRTGLLESTLVVWAGEFGRSADSGIRRGAKACGRDHNASAMTIWFAGGGVKAGHTIGATDETGRNAVEVVHSLKDVHSTILHLLGLDEAKSADFSAGRFQQLDETGGQPIRELLA